MSSAGTLDAIVVGSGPNGLAAAIELARRGHSVRVLEAADELGGGLRSVRATLPEFLHDECSAIHPLGVLSPFFESLDLAAHGLEWVPFPISVGHPLEADRGPGSAVLLERDLARTAAGLGVDERAWKRLLQPHLGHSRALLGELLAPLLRIPRHPLRLGRFGLAGLRSASGLARTRFEGDRARALFAGLAAHSILPLDRAGTAAVGLIFALAAHTADWPCVRGGSARLADALAACLRDLGGELETGHRVVSLDELPPARVVLLDLAPASVVSLAADRLPADYVRRLRRWHYGPATFKLDWALDGPIPWSDPHLARASTVHVGGTLEEIEASERDAWEGRIAERPYLIVCQQSALDPTRAPAGQHTGYAYAHVPSNCEVDVTANVEAQLERFAPGFRDRILARHATTPAGFEALNPNFVGGAITGGSATLDQLVARPALRFDPYATPNPRLFLCSASTPPGGGVHGMCGYHAARSAHRRLTRLTS